MIYIYTSCVLLSLAQLVGIMYNICMVCGSNLGHHKKKYTSRIFQRSINILLISIFISYHIINLLHHFISFGKIPTISSLIILREIFIQTCFDNFQTPFSYSHYLLTLSSFFSLLCFSPIKRERKNIVDKWLYKYHYSYSSLFYSLSLS
jgi:uncharacterized membrane protein (DUF373 family)